jgi:hypothetical protein
MRGKWKGSCDFVQEVPVYHSRFVYAIDHLKKSNVAVHNKPYVIVVWFSHDVT